MMELKFLFFLNMKTFSGFVADGNIIDRKAVGNLPLLRDHQLYPGYMIIAC